MESYDVSFKELLKDFFLDPRKFFKCMLWSFFMTLTFVIIWLWKCKKILDTYGFIDKRSD